LQEASGLGLWGEGLAYVKEWTGLPPTLDQQRLAAVIHATVAVLAIMVWIIQVYEVTGGWAGVATAGAAQGRGERRDREAHEGLAGGQTPRV
jgi:hypothetical protein